MSPFRIFCNKKSNYRLIVGKYWLSLFCFVDTINVRRRPS
nr:MAG TPA: Ribosome associated membrane protein RAMP4 [Caudoviricetes sp.]